MPLSVACPHCRYEYVVRDDAAGKMFRCRECDAVVTVPGGDAPPASEDDRGLAAEDSAPRRDEFDAPQFEGHWAGDREPPPSDEAPSAAPSPEPARYTPQAIVTLTSAPGIVLMLLGGISLVAFVFFFVVVGAVLRGGPAPGFPVQQPRDIENAMILCAVHALLDVVVIYAGWCLYRRSSYGVAFAGSILALVPCASPCCGLGIPVGLWALVVLLKPEVRDAFA